MNMFSEHQYFIALVKAGKYILVKWWLDVAHEQTRRLNAAKVWQGLNFPFGAWDVESVTWGNELDGYMYISVCMY